MNESGDMLAIDDFMGAADIDDLVDYVCDEWAEPNAPTVTLPPLPEPHDVSATLYEDGEVRDEHVYSADQMRAYARECLRAAGVVTTG
jgi:hypothetical protein